MGIDIHGTRLLLAAKATGVRFRETATIGRQHINLSPRELGELLGLGGVADADPERIVRDADGFCEPLLRALGAESIESVDASDYERATRVHDMNRPIPNDLEERFDAVLDYGSLEHVFNFPVAIANCMRMVRDGGHFLSVTCANNFMGHGFYQFSPELFFRLFRKENGFEMERVILVEVSGLTGSSRDRWYEVLDPARLGRRVLLLNNRPTYMLIQARRTEVIPVLTAPPQQSDFEAAWSQSKETSEKSSGWRSTVRVQRRRLKRRWGSVSGRRTAPGLQDDPAAFREVRFEDLISGAY